MVGYQKKNYNIKDGSRWWIRNKRQGTKKMEKKQGEKNAEIKGNLSNKKNKKHAIKN